MKMKPTESERRLILAASEERAQLQRQLAAADELRAAANYQRDEAHKAVRASMDRLASLSKRVARLEAALRKADDEFSAIRQFVKDPSSAYGGEYGGDVEGAVRYRCTAAREAIQVALAPADDAGGAGEE